VAPDQQLKIHQQHPIKSLESALMSLSALPDEVLKLVMQHVPQTERLTSCCLVSRRLHAAAVAATQELYGHGKTMQDADSCLEWICMYGQHLTRLSFLMFPETLRQLPCPDLLELEIEFSSVQLQAADGYPGVIQGCTNLTRLELTFTGIDAPQEGVLDSLSSLVHLQRLKVMTRPAVVGLSLATLPRLQQLTCLLVKSLRMENLSQLGTLTSLQELYLVGDLDAVGAAVGPRSVPGLVFPASLTKLEVFERFEAALLSLLPEGLQSLKVSELGVMEFDDLAEGHGSFLSSMAHLQHLTSLSLLPGNRIHWPPVGPAYSALTASSSLVQLVLCHTGMPDGVWLHMFPAACKLPFLTSLELKHAKTASPTQAPYFDDADFLRLVSCCPNLCEVGSLALKVEPHFSGVHNEHVELRLPELDKLTAMARLSVWLYMWDNDHYDVCMKGLAAVTQLRQLTVAAGAGFSAASLLPLTSLTALQHINVEWPTYHGGGDSDDEDGGGGGGVAHDDGKFSACSTLEVSESCCGTVPLGPRQLREPLCVP
jgi:hypothetical protein